MDISIIIDKSTFQSLNYDELYRLSCYYKHIITPVLIMEIIGDLKKEYKAGESSSEQRVKDFAKKLFPLETIVSGHYKILIKEDLLGNTVVMDGRPNVGAEKAVVSESGQKGFVIEETIEEKAIYNWKAGKFTEADHTLSLLWRMLTTEEQLLENLKKILLPGVALKFSDFTELEKYVQERITSSELQEKLLVSLFQNYGIGAQECVEIFGRWELLGKPSLKEFSPYAFHCLKVDCLFFFGLKSGLISTRPTNRVDVEYLYYLPFANVFTSNDKVHKNLVPLLLLSHQKFVLGTELKEDLKGICTYLDSIAIGERRKFKNEPPIVKGSLTFKLWKEFFNYPAKGPWNRKISDGELEKMKEKMEEFHKATKGGRVKFKPGEEAFIVKESKMSMDDPCFCGSGEKVVACCIPRHEFMKIILDQFVQSKLTWVRTEAKRSPPIDK